MVQPVGAGGYYQGRTARWCEVRQRWSDSWQPVPWLRPIKLRDQCAPGLAQAVVSRDFGRILQNGQTAAATFAPIDFTEWYLRIVTQKVGQQPAALWTGVVLQDDATIDRTSSLAGEQELTVVGLDVLLDRTPIVTGYVKEGSSVIEIGRLPDFNRRATMRTVLGNRSSAASSDDAYRFSRDGEKWSPKQVLQYLFAKHLPAAGPAWELCGQLDALDPRPEQWKCHGKTLREILSMLVDRKRGLGWRVVVDGQKAQVWVFTLADQAITAGSQQLPANAQPIYLALPTAAPWHHLLGPLRVRQTATASYDVVEARAKHPLLVTATFAFEDSTLAPGWKTALYTSYKLGVQGGTPSESDAMRGRAAWEGLFTRYVVPREWDGRTGGADENITKKSARPEAMDDGNFAVNVVANYWTYGQRFLPTTTLEKQVDYTANPIDRDDQPEDTEPEFRAPFAFLFDSTDGALHKASGKYYPLDRLHEFDPNFRSMTVRPLERQLGFEISVLPRHYLALNHIQDFDTNYEPEFDFEDIGITATFVTDQYPRVERRISEPQETERRLVIEVAGAEYWFCVPNTVVGIDPTLSSLERLPSSNRWLRKDQEALEAAVGFAYAWFAVPRQAIDIPIQDLGFFAPLGAMLTGVSGSAVGLWIPIRTVVSARGVDFKENLTTLQTSWGSLDYWDGN